MSKSRLADFLLVGAGVAPVVLGLGGHLSLGIMVMIPLLFIGCLLGIAELLKDKDKSPRDE
jgi:hypothetical protein